MSSGYQRATESEMNEQNTAQFLWTHQNAIFTPAHMKQKPYDLHRTEII